MYNLIEMDVKGKYLNEKCLELIRLIWKYVGNVRKCVRKYLIKKSEII